MGRARKSGRGTKAGVGVKKGKKIRPVKLKRRQAPLNARARPIWRGDWSRLTYDEIANSAALELAPEWFAAREAGGSVPQKFSEADAHAG